MSDDVALFLDRLRFVLGRLDPVDVGLLNEKTAPYRADMVFEVGADFVTALEDYDAGRVDETVVREAAVAVAVEAVKVWLATCTGGREDGR